MESDGKYTTKSHLLVYLLACIQENLKLCTDW